MIKELSFDVEMTREDLAESVAKSCTDCPLAHATLRALEKHLPEARNGLISVGAYRTRLSFDLNEHHVELRMEHTPAITGFIESFDSGLVPDPISFRFVGFSR